jgi:hypothetical protein
MPHDETPVPKDGAAGEGPSPYDLPTELDGRAVPPPGAGPPEDDGGQAPAPPGRRLGLRAGMGLALVALAVAALVAYRSVHRARVLAEGTAKAAALLRLDTASGFREAAALLEPLATLDPLAAGSMRAFALAMLAADYRDADAAAAAEVLLIEPGRADQVPVYADLATAALFMGRRSVGDATTYAGRARSSPWGGAIQGRLALLADNPEAGLEPAAAAAAADAGLAAAPAVLGDLARRARQDAPSARAAYLAALAISPQHPRAAFGLGKLALQGQVPLADALPPLKRILAGDAATPRNERARAGLYLAALSRRVGDGAAAQAALDAIGGLDAGARSWAENAAATLSAERRRYRAVRGAPALFQSASDDDPPEVPAMAPPPPPAPPRPAAAPARHAVKAPASPAKAPARKAAPAAKTAAAKKGPAAKAKTAPPPGKTTSTKPVPR